MEGTHATRAGPATIVAGFDGTEASVAALERAADVAEAFGSRLVVTVVEHLYPAAGIPPVGGVEMAMASPELAMGGWDRDRSLGHARRILADRDVRFELVAPLGSPAAEILHVAEEQDADLVVVGAGEHGFLMRLLGGGVSGSVAREAGCDVLLVHGRSAGNAEVRGASAASATVS